MGELNVKTASVNYGGAQALKDVTVGVESGGTLAIVGRNGAGKTTLLRLIGGAVRPEHGNVFWDGIELAGNMRAAAKSGIRLVPESGNTFPDLTVWDNLRSGAPWLDRKESNRRIDSALETFSILVPLIKRKAGNLSGGERQTLAVARALMARPTILLVDEPTLGLSLYLAQVLLENLLALAKHDGMTIVLAEQNAALALSLCESACWLDTGRVRAFGAADEVSQKMRDSVLM